MESLQRLWHDYMTKIVVECGGADTSSPRPEELDNTKHTAGCSLAATPGILVFVGLVFALKTLLCPSKRRTLYAGSEDAPELEEIVSSGRRVDAYSSSHGRLVTGDASSSGSSRKKKTGTPRPLNKNRGRGGAAEMEPVLWSR